MSDTENKTSEVAELKEQCDSLNQQATFLLYALVVISLIVTGFIGIQAKWAGAELEMNKPQMLLILENGKRQQAWLHEFLGRMVEFSKTHPDYQPIVQRFVVVRAGSSNAPVSVTPATHQ